MLRQHTRALDPVTRDRVFNDTLHTWAEPVTNELAIVQNVLSTELGSAGRDRTYGVARLENAGPNVAALWRQNVLRALARWIKAGVLRDVEVASETRPLDGGGSVLLYTVSFRGRDGRARTTNELRALT